MASPTQTPILTASFCFSPVAVQDFLRQSRASLDDPITSSLNALVTPSATPFDPTSTSRRNPASSRARRIPASSCAAFKKELLFPSWQSRSEVLEYCQSFVTKNIKPVEDLDMVAKELEEQDDRRKIIDARADPYSTRKEVTNTKEDILRDILKEERAVEGIVRNRTWNVVGNRCEDTAESWQEAFAAWRWADRREGNRYRETV